MDTLTFSVLHGRQNWGNIVKEHKYLKILILIIAVILAVICIACGWCIANTENDNIDFGEVYKAQRDTEYDSYVQ